MSSIGLTLDLEERSITMRSTGVTGLAFFVVLASACSRAPDSPPSTGSPPAVASSPEAEKELKALEGVWVWVEEEWEGEIEKLPEGAQDVVTIKGNEYKEVRKPSQITSHGTIVVDPTRKPKAFVIHLSDALPGEKVTKVYELAGDALRMHTVYRGDKFPTGLSSKETKEPVRIYKRKK
jgi:uncharacterized protein (TIGR03067 family)